jgi:hypothetical protein
MLAALLFAGLAAAAILPSVFDGVTDDDDTGLDEAGGAGKGSFDAGAKSLLDSATADESGDAAGGAPADMPVGTAYEVSAAKGTAVLSEFDAGCDSCTLTTDTLDGEFAVETDPSGKGSTLTFTTSGGETSVLSFPNLDAVPVEAIGIRVESEGAPAILPLADIFAAGEELGPETEDDASPLSPTDPDAPDTLPDLPDIDAVLSPVDPDLADVLPTDLVDGEVLQPVLDSLGLIKVDPDTGVPVPVIVKDFGETDILSVTLSETAAKGALEVAIKADPSGEGVVVLVDGKAVALLPDTKEVLPSQVKVAFAGKSLI